MFFRSSISIKITFVSDTVISCILSHTRYLNVKGAYDYVSIKQLLNVMKKLHLSFQIFNWVKEFMSNRSIRLAFDGKKQEQKQIRTEISQESSISSI
jgi:hypothetical protein